MTKKEVDALLTFYKEKGRLLPWRMSPTPYHVYVSEIRLQQTRVEAVKEHYLRFIAAFPTREDFVRAKEDDYLKLWQGLGYYSRVKNRHKARSLLVSEHRGIPQSAKELLTLPGIGEYTSKSIASIAFQGREVSVDGNLFRIFARLREYPKPFSPAAKKDCEKFFRPFLPDRPGDFNQALRDLGEMICLPKGMPLCSSCPFKDSCLGYKHSSFLLYPKSRKKKEKKEENRVLFFLLYQGKVLLHKRADDGLLASLYEPINVSSVEEGLSLYSLSKSQRTYLGSYNHVFSHRIWKRKAYYFLLGQPPALGDRDVLASREELASFYSIPSAFSPFFSLLKEKKLLS